ncbi:MAG: phytanoyl-CoA dioxygenase family protein [Planctomycetes bacterium]|nr:phytanoyl-CoA dioxygenase family protein [Planctomycetota bacterium]
MTQTQQPENRILRFFPASTANPRRLTREQVARFNEKGYVTGLDVYTPTEADRNRAYFDMLLKRVEDANDGRDAYSINGYHCQCAGLWDIVTEPRILDYVQDILGPDFVAWGTHYFCKLPRDPKHVPWHQDASYWPLTPSKTVTVWLAIDDADRANGAMKVIPGTHTKGHLAFDHAGPDEKVVLGQKVRNAESFGDPAWIELKAGQISLHADMLVHGSDPNTSDRRRCGLTIRYATTDVRSTANWNKMSILCRGADAENYWANLPRPADDTPAALAWQKPAPGAAS